MRALLFLSVIGAAIYALLVVTDKVAPEGQPNDIVAGQTQPSHHGVRELRSWGNNLPSLVISQRPSPRHAQQNAASAPGPYREHLTQSSQEQTVGPNYQPAAPDGKVVVLEAGGPEQEPFEWAKVMLAARVHSEASVSSAIVRFYPPGTELRIMSRKDGWLQLSDPVTQESGWVFDKYLASIDGPSPTQAAESNTEPLPALAVSLKPKDRSRSGAFRGDDVVAKSELRKGRWARRGDRRRGFRLFGRFAAR
jgi:hypothetical protein